MQDHLLNGFSPWRILNAFLAGSRTVSPRSNTPSFPRSASKPLTLETISRALTMSKTKAGGWDAREVDMRLRVE